MTLMEAIGQADALYFNTFSQSEKVGWLSRLDGLIHTQILQTHEGEPAPFPGYGPDTDPDRLLLVPPPYDCMYISWLQAQMELALRETEGYNAAIQTFNAEYSAYEKDYNRNHMPKNKGYFRFGGGNGR